MSNAYEAINTLNWHLNCYIPFKKKDRTMQILDLRGYISPFTLLKVSNALKEIPTEGILEILWSNPETSSDLFKVLPAASYEVIVMETIGGEKRYYRAKLKKRGRSELTNGFKK